MNEEHIIEVRTLKELPGLPAGTILRKAKKGGCTGSFLPPQGIDAEGCYVPINSHLIFEWKWYMSKYPDFFEPVTCGCTCCSCVGCACKCSK